MSTSPTLAHILPPQNVQKLAQAWLAEDAPTIDAAGYIVGERKVEADLYLKSDAVLAGKVFVEAVFNELKCTVVWHEAFPEGKYVNVGPGDKVAIATVTGGARRVLLGERASLNAFAECCAVASVARRAVEIGKKIGWKGRVAGTRKTTPGFRLVQKYGMIVGGMDMHRMDLSGMVMLKDNHVRVVGGVDQAVGLVRKVVGFSVKIDVECGCLDEAVVAAGAGADVVMLDNFGRDGFVEGAKKIKEKFPGVVVEGSGGIGLEDIEGYMVKEADVISFSVNRYVQPVDVSLKIN